MTFPTLTLSSLPTKLVALLVLALTGFTLMAGFLMVDQYHAHQKTGRMAPFAHLTVRLSTLVHEIQTERGLSAGFLWRDAPVFQRLLAQQRHVVQEQVGRFKTLVHTTGVGIDGHRIQLNMQLLLEELEKITAIRDAVDARRIGPAEVIDRYSKINLTLLGTVPLTAFFSHNPIIPMLSASFFNFLHLKETAGIERAILAHTFANGHFVPGLRDRLLVLRGETVAHAEFFLALSSLDLRALYQQAQSGPEFAEVNRLRALALAHTGEGGFDVEANRWFEAATRRIQRFQEIEDLLEKELLAAIESERQTARYVFWLYGMGVVVLLATILAMIVSTMRHATRNLLMAREITERKRVESTLKKNENRFRSIYEGLPMGYQSLDAQGRIIDVNKVWEKIVGYGQHEVLGKPFLALLTDASVEQFLESFQALKHQDGENYLELEVLQRDGETMFISVESSVDQDEWGQFKQVHCILSDITERRRLGEQLRKAKEKAEEMSRIKSRFLATMSHEIRTPLNAVIGLNEHLLDTEENAVRRRYLELAKKGGENLLALINDILDLSKIEANQMILERMSFPLSDLVRKTASMVEHQCLEKGIGLVVTLAPDLPSHTIGDPQRLTQILLNLLGNAIKFTEMGEVTVKVQRGEGEEILFVLSDTGIGIPKEKWKSIFEPFTQADNSSTRRFGGTGLGLDICRRLVELMGGRIWVKSEVNVGSQFHFTSPLPEGAGVQRILERRTRNRPEKDDAVRSLRILMAEDVVESAMVVQAFLSKTPHSLVVVENGQQALERFQSETYDLVLMDVQMPVMDGFTATRNIRAWEKAHERLPTPILALTAHALQVIAHEVLEAGCDLHLTKPISKHRLLGIIHHFASGDMTPLEEIGGSVAMLETEENHTETTGVVPAPEVEPVVSLNITTLDTLCRSLGGNTKPIEQFVDNLPQRVSDMARAVEDHASDRLDTSAHKLKGTARMFVAERLAEISWKLEVIGKEGVIPEGGQWLEDLESEALKVEQAISAYVQRDA